MLQRSPIFYPLCAFLIALAVALRWFGLPFQTHDMQDFLLPWFDYIVTHGRFAALSDNFYNYTPPYIYLMTLASYLDGVFDRVVLIKTISLIFDAVAAFMVYRIALFASSSVRRAVLCALMFLNLPTLILNGAFWGQCDIIFTTFLLAFAYFIIRSRPFWAMIAYAVALSLKVQAIFAAPFVAYLLLAGEMPLIYVTLPPLVYAILVLPAAIAGRGWPDLLTIYAGQADIPNDLSARAPNIYAIIQRFLPPDLNPAAVIVGVAVAALSSFALLVTNFRRKENGTPLFVIASLAFWMALEPSLLPKMHDRYFFGADIFAFMLAVFVPRAWWVAIFFQAGSALAYSYFMTIGHETHREFYYAALLGAFAVIPATIGLGWYYWKALKSPVGYSAAA